ASWLGEAGRKKLRRYGDLVAQGKSGAAVLASVLAGPGLRWAPSILLLPAELLDRQRDPPDMLATIHAQCGVDVTRQLPEIAARTLVIAGARDRAFTRDLTERTAAGIPHAKLILYSSRGHVGTMFDPRFGRDVAAFLNA